MAVKPFQRYLKSDAKCDKIYYAFKVRAQFWLCAGLMPFPITGNTLKQTVRCSSRVLKNGGKKS